MVAYALLLLAIISWLSTRKGVFPGAARLYGAAETLRESIGLTRDPPGVPEYERSLAAAREQAIDRSWKLAWAEGRAMSSEQVLSYALGESVGC